MRKIILLIVLITCLHNNLFSQWQECTNGMNQVNIHIDALIQVGDNIIAGTSYYYPPSIGSIFISTDNGNNWILKKTGLENYQINSFAICSNRILAGYGNTKTLNGGILISTDNGETWIEQTDKNNKSYIFKLGVNNNNVFASTMNGVFYSSDSGDTWTAENVNLPLNTRIYSLATSGNRVYAGTEQNGLFRSFSASYWEHIGDFENLDWSTTIWAIGANGPDLYVGNRVKELLYSSDYGTTWTKTDLITFDPINSIIIKDDTLYAGGNGGVFCSTDKFKTWTNFTSGMHFTGSNSMLIKGDYCFAGGTNLYRAKIKDLFDKHETLFDLTFIDRATGEPINDLNAYLYIRDSKNLWDVIDYKGTGKGNIGKFKLDTRGSYGPFLLEFKDTNYAPSSMLFTYDELKNMGTIELDRIDGIPIFIKSLEGKEKDMALIQCPVTITAETDGSAMFGIDSSLKTTGYLNDAKMLNTKPGKPMALILPQKSVYAYRIYGISDGEFTFDIWKSTIKNYKRLTYKGNITSKAVGWITLYSDTTKNNNLLYIDLNSDGNADTTLLPISNIDDIEDNTSNLTSELKISPNPASDFINVDLSFLRMQESAIKIFNIFGKCVLTVETGLRPVSTRIDVSALPTGTYFLRAGNEVYKFIVVR